MNTMAWYLRSQRIGLAALVIVSLGGGVVASAQDTAPTRYVGPFGPDGQTVSPGGPATGQPATEWVEPRPLMPVDRTVGDLDPHAASQRWVDPAQAAFAPGAQLYLEGFGPTGSGDNAAAGLGLPAANPHTGLTMAGQFRYQAPGVQAWMDRPDYLVQTGPGGQYSLNVSPLREGAALALIPPNTVFNLIPPDQLDSPAPAELDDAAAGPDHRLDRRVDTRIDARVDGQADRAVDLDAIERARRQGQTPPR